MRRKRKTENRKIERGKKYQREERKTKPEEHRPPVDFVAVFFTFDCNKQKRYACDENSQPLFNTVSKAQCEKLKISVSSAWRIQVQATGHRVIHNQYHRGAEQIDVFSMCEGWF